MIYFETFNERVIALSSLLALLIILITYLVIKTHLDLEDFSRVEGRVAYTKLIFLKNSKGRSNETLVIKLDSFDKLFGVHEKHQSVLKYLKENDPEGQEMTIYYDPEGIEVTDNLTLHIGQIELDGQIFMDLEESKHVDKLGIKILTPVCAFLVFGFAYLIYQKKAGKI